MQKLLLWLYHLLRILLIDQIHCHAWHYSNKYIQEFSFTNVDFVLVLNELFDDQICKPVCIHIGFIDSVLGHRCLYNLRDYLMHFNTQIAILGS